MRKFFILLAVLVALASKGFATTFESVGLYQSFDELTAWAQEFSAANPDLVSLVEYGRSYQDRPLLALQITLQPGGNHPSKPEFLFTGGIHAREVISSESMYHLAMELVEGYRDGDPAFFDILAEREVWILPNLNPDGRVRVEDGFSSQRKNMQAVDLNRNFPHRWEQAEDSIASEVYRGPSVLSTPEASALWNLLHDSTKFDHLLGAIDFHSGAEMIISPWLSLSEFSEFPLPEAHRTKFDSLASQMSQASGIGIDRLSYDSYGTLADSLYEEFGTYSFLEELYLYPSYDTFVRFNPIDAPTLEDRVSRAVDSALFLLSDEAFSLVPEPASGWLLAMGVASWIVVARRKRI